MINGIEIFGIKIYFYALIMVSAIILGVILAHKEWIKQKLNEEIFYNLVFSIIIFAFLGARTWYVLFSNNLDWYIQNPLQIINLRGGGLAIHGAIVGGLLTIIYYAKKYNLKFLQLTDIIVVSLIIGQVIGRWGNFFNQEAHGPATTLAFLQSIHLPTFIIEGMNINGTYYQPTFLYESVWNLIGFFIILFIRKKVRYKYGIITAFYLIWYGIIRSFIEMLRTDALLLGSIKVAQFTSILMFIGGIILLIILINKYYFKGDKNENCN